jgi:hypothetical protein
MIFIHFEKTVLHVKTQTIGTFCWDIFADGMVAFSACVGAICKSPLQRWWFDATI